MHWRQAWRPSPRLARQEGHAMSKIAQPPRRRARTSGAIGHQGRRALRAALSARAAASRRGRYALHSDGSSSGLVPCRRMRVRNLNGCSGSPTDPAAPLAIPPRPCLSRGPGSGARVEPRPAAPHGCCRIAGRGVRENSRSAADHTVRAACRGVSGKQHLSPEAAADLLMKQASAAAGGMSAALGRRRARGSRGWAVVLGGRARLAGRGHVVDEPVF